MQDASTAGFSTKPVSEFLIFKINPQQLKYLLYDRLLYMYVCMYVCRFHPSYFLNEISLKTMPVRDCFCIDQVKKIII